MCPLHSYKCIPSVLEEIAKRERERETVAKIWR